MPPVMYVCSANECPPEDQMWLILSRSELARDAEALEARKTLWSSGDFSFPTSGSFSDVHAWGNKVNAAVLDDFFEYAYGPQPEDVLPKILLDRVPEDVELQVMRHVTSPHFSHPLH